MRLIRGAFWVGVAVLLLPADERQQARIYDTTAAAFERVTTFCDRNASACEAGSAVWAAFVRKAEFAGRLAYDLAVSGGKRDDAQARTEPASATARPRPPAGMQPAPRGTLRPDDLSPAWRGQGGRSGA